MQYIKENAIMVLWNLREMTTELMSSVSWRVALLQSTGQTSIRKPVVC